MQGKKILFISSNKNPKTKYSTRFTSFINELSKNNEVRALDLTQHFFLYSDYSIWKLVILRILRYLLIFPDVDVLLLNRYKEEIKKNFDSINFDIVIIGIVPSSLLSLAEFIKMNYNCTLILDMADPITKNIDFSKYSKFRQNYLLKFESQYIKYIDKLIVLNPEIADYYNKMYPELKSVQVVEQGFEGKLYLKSKTELNSAIDTINLIYAGHLYKKSREPFELYKAIQDLSESNLKLSIYGGFKFLYFDPPKTKNFFFGGHISREALEAQYLESDIVVFIDNKDTLQVPGKTFEVLSFNKPILYIYYNEDSPTMKYFKKYDGIEYAKNNKEDIVIAIKNLINTSYNINRDVSEYFWENLAIKFASILDS